jgi:hypothetical protein
MEYDRFAKALRRSGIIAVGLEILKTATTKAVM